MLAARFPKRTICRLLAFEAGSPRMVSATFTPLSPSFPRTSRRLAGVRSRRGDHRGLSGRASARGFPAGRDWACAGSPGSFADRPARKLRTDVLGHWARFPTALLFGSLRGLGCSSIGRAANALLRLTSRLRDSSDDGVQEADVVGRSAFRP